MAGVLDILSWVFLITGSFFVIVGGIGLLRLDHPLKGKVLYHQLGHPFESLSSLRFDPKKRSFVFLYSNPQFLRPEMFSVRLHEYALFWCPPTQKFRLTHRK